jgi:hypothetical protein
MICKPCGIAGDLAAVAGDNDGFSLERIILDPGRFDFPTDAVVRTVAHLYHGLCKGKTHCDCQHFVTFIKGSVVERGKA